MNSNASPEISLTQLIAKPTGPQGEWAIKWQMQNRGAEPLQIAALRLPHGQFKSEEKCFRPALELNRGEKAQIETLVRCHEPPGLVTENAFAIFHVNWLSDAWRIFVRLRVTVNADGEPRTTTELITTQQVGFSGQID